MCHEPQAVLLGGVDGKGSTAVAGAPSGFHLTEHDQVTASVATPSDDVDLTSYVGTPKKPVAFDDRETSSHQMRCRQVFSPAATRLTRPIGQKVRFSLTLAALPTRSRR